MRVSAVGLLFAAFVFCKVAGITRIAELSWWWVTSPLWIYGVGLVLLSILKIAADAKK